MLQIWPFEMQDHLIGNYIASSLKSCFNQTSIHVNKTSQTIRYDPYDNFMTHIYPCIVHIIWCDQIQNNFFFQIYFCSAKIISIRNDWLNLDYSTTYFFRFRFIGRFPCFLLDAPPSVIIDQSSAVSSSEISSWNTNDRYKKLLTETKKNSLVQFPRSAIVNSWSLLQQLSTSSIFVSFEDDPASSGRFNSLN